MTYALVEIQGKQYKAEKGKKLIVDLCQAKEGDSLDFPVLMVNDDSKVTIGAPHVSGASVKTTVEKSFRDKKVDIFKYNRRKGYRRSRGHRQSYTLLMVNEIAL